LFQPGALTTVWTLNNLAADIDASLVGGSDTFLRLKERFDQLAGTMSHGKQALLSGGRGLMAVPGLPIIDKLTLGRRFS
jgi:branched-chain amino acid transport system ATP-binding protein